MSGKPQIGWVGLGKMGIPMSKRLLEHGYPVCVYNRTKAKAKEVLDAGATYCETLAQVAAKSDIVFGMIADDKALAAITLGDDALIKNMKPGSIFIEMSTVSPKISAEVDALCAAKGVKYLRAPVSGSTVLAAAGTLTVLCSGPKDAYDQALPLFLLLSKAQFHVGTKDEARYMKLVLNIMIGLSSAMVGEALVFGEAGGLNWDQMLDVVDASVLASPLIKYKIPPLRKRDYSPAFGADQIAKDFDLALDAGKAVDVPMPLTSLVRQFWTMMHTQGKGETDFFGYVALLEDIAKVKKT